MKKLIVVADWASDSLTCQEFRSSAEGFIKNSEKNVNIHFISSTPSTIHTSFLVNQAVLTEERFGRPLSTIVFQNTDPRIQTTEGVDKAKGAEFIVVRLKSGLYVYGPNSGYVYSLIKSEIDEVFIYKNLDKGSQFRSRDLYSRVSAHLMDEMENEMDLDETHINIIPELSGHYIGHIDNYGNIKTTMKIQELKGRYEFGDEIKIKINNIEKKAKFVSNLFGGVLGQLVIYPGSSGDKNNPYLEISIWRHFTEKRPTTGIHEFNLPLPGNEIFITQ